VAALQALITGGSAASTDFPKRRAIEVRSADHRVRGPKSRRSHGHLKWLPSLSPRPPILNLACWLFGNVYYQSEPKGTRQNPNKTAKSVQDNLATELCIAVTPAARTNGRNTTCTSGSRAGRRQWLCLLLVDADGSTQGQVHLRKIVQSHTQTADGSSSSSYCSHLCCYSYCRCLLLSLLLPLLLHLLLLLHLSAATATVAPTPRNSCYGCFYRHCYC